MNEIVQSLGPLVMSTGAIIYAMGKFHGHVTSKIRENGKAIQQLHDQMGVTNGKILCLEKRLRDVEKGNQ